MQQSSHTPSLWGAFHYSFRGLSTVAVTPSRSLASWTGPKHFAQYALLSTHHRKALYAFQLMGDSRPGVDSGTMQNSRRDSRILWPIGYKPFPISSAAATSARAPNAGLCGYIAHRVCVDLSQQTIHRDEHRPPEVRSSALPMDDEMRTGLRCDVREDFWADGYNSICQHPYSKLNVQNTLASAMHHLISAKFTLSIATDAIIHCEIVAGHAVRRVCGTVILIPPNLCLQIRRGAFLPRLASRHRPPATPRYHTQSNVTIPEQLAPSHTYPGRGSASVAGSPPSARLLDWTWVSQINARKPSVSFDDRPSAVVSTTTFSGTSIGMNISRSFAYHVGHHAIFIAAAYRTVRRLLQGLRMNLRI